MDPRKPFPGRGRIPGERRKVPEAHLGGSYPLRQQQLFRRVGRHCADQGAPFRQRLPIHLRSAPYVYGVQTERGVPPGCDIDAGGI